MFASSQLSWTVASTPLSWRVCGQKVTGIKLLLFILLLSILVSSKRAQGHCYKNIPFSLNEIKDLSSRRVIPHWHVASPTPLLCELMLSTLASFFLCGIIILKNLFRWVPSFFEELSFCNNNRLNGDGCYGVDCHNVAWKTHLFL